MPTKRSPQKTGRTSLLATMKYNTPIPSTRKNKKFMVKVLDKATNRDVIVHFGYSPMQDYTQHGDIARKRNYLSRASGIRDKEGRLTKDNPLSPNYWSIRYLWGPKKSPKKINVT